MLNVLRWVAVIPGALALAILSTFPLHFVLYQTLTGSGIVEPYPEYSERLIVPFVATLVFVWVGSRIAPSRKVEVAAFLLGALLFLIAAIFALSATETRLGNVQFYLAFGPVAPLLGVVGAFAGLYLAHRHRLATVEDDVDA